MERPAPPPFSACVPGPGVELPSSPNSTGLDMSTRSAGVLVILVMLCMLGWYADTALSVVHIWERAETFAHGFVVLPISAWLVWRRRAVLAALPAKPAPLALLFLALAGFAWLLAELASVVGVAQFALLFMMIFATWAIVGTQIVKAIAFPLGFLVFAVPAGEFLLPVMMDMTADFTIGALRFSGVPVFREGRNFVIPNGSWSVVEACSGIRYLISSLMVGTLYAYLNYRTMYRRLVFVGASILVPVVANWLRAYMIVMIGYLSGNRLATGVDHLIYGWLFFGVVMMLLFWIGSFWQESEPQAATSSSPASRFPGRPLLLAAACAAAVSLAWRPILATLDGRGGNSVPELAQVAAGQGWRSIGPGSGALKPHFLDPRAELRQEFEKDGRRVALYIAYYRQQTQGRELVTSGNRLVLSEDKVWSVATTGRHRLASAAGAVDVHRTELFGAAQRLVVWHWYRVGDRIVTSDYLAKLLLAWAKLSGTRDDSAVVVVSTQKRDAGDAADRVLEQFLKDTGAGIEAMLSRTERN